jgi:hypothetical protein
MTNWDLYFQKQVGDTEMKRLIEEEMKRLIEEEIKILRIEQAVPGICTRSNPYTCPMEPHTHPREVDPLVAAARRGFAGHSREQAAPLARHHHEAGAPLTSDCDNWCRGKRAVRERQIISCHDHGNCELCDQIERELSDARAAIREAYNLFYAQDYSTGSHRAAWLALPAVVAALKEPPHAD